MQLNNLQQRLIWLRKYAFELCKWFWATQPVIAPAAALLTVVVLCVLSSGCLERQIRLSGMGLQLVGIFVVAVGLMDTRRTFKNQPTLWESIKQWWTARPPYGPQHYVLRAKGVAVGGPSFGAARMRQNAAPKEPLDQRVALLEQQYAALFDEVGALSGDTKAALDELLAGLQQNAPTALMVTNA